MSKDVDVKTGKVNLRMKCADCLHFKGPKSRLYPSRCSELGRQGYANVCEGFTPNFTAINRAGGSLDAAMRLSRLSQGMSTSQLRILACLLARQTLFSKFNMHFGQPLYVFLEPTIGMTKAGMQELGRTNFDYLENYYKAYAIGVTNLGEGLYELCLSSKLEGKPDYYVIVNLKEGRTLQQVFTVEKFKKIAEKLVAKGKEKMPKALRTKLKTYLTKLPAPRAKELADYEVPTIDNVPYEWYASSSHNHKSRKGLRLDTRVSMPFVDDSGKKHKPMPKKAVKFEITSSEPSRLKIKSKLGRKA